jgi:cytochrome c556
MLFTMRKASLLVSALAFGAFGLLAQDELATYQTWMKTAAGSNAALKTAVTAKDAAAISENSKKVAESFDQMAKFWAAKHKDDAAKLAETARDAAKSVPTASADDQTAALAKINGTCRSCHTTYRDGSKFKEL